MWLWQKKWEGSTTKIGMAAFINTFADSFLNSDVVPWPSRSPDLTSYFSLQDTRRKIGRRPGDLGKLNGRIRDEIAEIAEKHLRK
jgi:hypothetical protein